MGIGEQRAKTDVEVLSGNVKLAMSHVVPDIVQKILKGQKPFLCDAFSIIFNHFEAKTCQKATHFGRWQPEAPLHLRALQ